MIFCKEGETVYQTETVYDNVTGLPVRQLTKSGDVLESLPNDMPSQVLFDSKGRVVEKVWHSGNEIHRDKNLGPAMIKINPENGIHIVESYINRGKRSRSKTEPAVIVRDSVSGNVLSKAFYSEGIELRPPAGPLAPTL